MRQKIQQSSVLRTAVCAVALLSFSQAANAQTLQDSILLAYDTNPEIRAERERARAIDENVAQARAGFLPTISASAQAGESQQESRRLDSFGVPVMSNDADLDPQSLNLQAVLPLFSSGQTYYRFKGANASARSAHATYRSAEQKFLLSIIASFMDVRRDEESVRIRENNLSVLGRELSSADARYKAGDGTKTDIAQAKARLAGAEAGLASALADRDASRAAYERVVGQPPVGLETPPPPPSLIANVDDAITQAFASNPDVLSANLAADAAKFGVRSKSAELGPKVDLVLQANDAREANFQGDRDEAVSLVARVTLPLFDAGLVRSQVRQSKISQYQADALELDARNRAAESVKSAWARLTAARAVEAASKSQVTASEAAFAGVSAEQKAGLRSSLDVLDAEQELLDARLAVARAQRDVYVAEHTYLASYGGLTLGSVAPNGKAYDPETHLKKVRRTVVTTSAQRLRPSVP